MRHGALPATDPPDQARRSADPDDYLLALTEHERAVLVSGDQHLLELADALPIQTARALLDNLAATWFSGINPQGTLPADEIEP